MIGCGGRTRARPPNHPIRSLRRIAGSLVLASFGLCGASRAARADAFDRSGSVLEWNAGPGCPDAVAAKAVVDGYLGDMSAASPMSIRVELTPAEDGTWQGRVSLRSEGGDGDRSFRGPTCAEVAEAATLIVAIMVDPLRMAARVEALDEAAHRSAGARSPERSVAFDVGIETSTDLSSLPAPTLGLSLVAGAHMGRGLIRAALTGWVPQRAFRGSDASSGGVLGLYSVGLRGCFDVLSASGGQFGVGPCAGAELGLATGRGFGLDVAETTTGPWAAAFAGLGARFGTDPVGSWLSVDIGTPLLRPVYVIDESILVFQASRVLVRASLGMAWKFP
jgi:hypothetical protein